MKPWRRCTASTKIKNHQQNQEHAVESQIEPPPNDQNECLNLNSVALRQQKLQKHQQSSTNSYQIEPLSIIRKNIQT